MLKKISTSLHHSKLNYNSYIWYRMSSIPDPKQSIKSKLQIADKKQINHDSYIYNLKWIGPKFKLGIGQHLHIIQNLPTQQHPQGQLIIRKYTPISLCSQENFVELLIKIYRPNTLKEKPEGGKMTPYLQKLKIGDYINVCGPFGKFGYQRGGIVNINGKQMKKKRIFFIAGGSGITPCYQTIRQILQLNEPNISLILLYANKTLQDITLKAQLQHFQPNLSLYYTLDMIPSNWNYLTGYITKQMLLSICPLNDPDTLYIYCGPKKMNQIVKDIFQLHFNNSTIFKF